MPCPLFRDTPFHSLTSSLAVRGALLSCLAVALLSVPATAQDDPGEVASLVEIASGSGGFGGPIDAGDEFGASVAEIGDLDDDGVVDLAVGAPGDDDGGTDRGALWILFMNADGTVKSSAKISDTNGNLPIGLLDGQRLGRSVAGLGDIDGDGNEDIAIGLDENNLFEEEASVWILFLDSNGSVLSANEPLLGGPGFADGFGCSITNMGDLDGNGTVDLAVGANMDSAFASAQGLVYFIYLDSGGNSLGLSFIGNGGLNGSLDPGDMFGTSVLNVGDLDGNGINDIAVGAIGDDDFDFGKGAAEAGKFFDLGAVWIIYLDLDGLPYVSDFTKISLLSGGFTGGLDTFDEFGASLTLLDDLDGNGARELAVGAPGDDDITPAALGGIDAGAVWVLFMEADETTSSFVKISDTSGGLPTFLDFGDAFGSALAAGDFDNDGSASLLAGLPGAFGGGSFFNMALATAGGGGDANQPYEGAVTTLAGRPGRATLVVLPPDSQLPPPPDFIGTPVIIVPKSDGDLVRVQGVSATAGGSGSFTDEGSYPSGDAPAQASAGNFNALSSGLIGGVTALSDVAIANFGSDSVSVLLGNSDGTFTPAPDTTLFNDVRPVAIQVGDFDGDLLDDVAVAGAFGVSVLLGDGFGGFSLQTFTPVSDLTDLAVGFIDDDAFLDVVTASGALAGGPGLESGFATVLLGNGDGTLTNNGTFADGQALASVLLGDLDQSGGNDVLLTTHQYDAGPGGIPQGLINLYLGDGSGGFTSSGVFIPYPTPDPGGIHPTYGALADVNGDFLVDAVYTSSPNIAYPVAAFEDQHPPLVVTVLTNDGAGGFDVLDLGTAYSGKGVSAVLEDFTVPGDDLADVVLVWFEDTLAGTGTPSTQNETFLALLVGNGTDDIFEDSTPNQYATGDEPGSGVVGNVDEPGTDGLDTPDLVIPNRRDNSLTVLLGKGDGTFQPGPTVTDVDDTVPPGPDWVGGPVDVRFGGVKVLGGEVFGFPLVVYNEWQEPGKAPAPASIASLSLFMRDGDGSFTRVQQLPLPGAGSFAQLDMTDDGATDIVATQSGNPGGPDAILVYPGLGPAAGAVSGTPVVTPVPANMRLTGGLHIADVMGSELPDVVTSAVDDVSGAGFVMVFENVGGEVRPGTAFPMNESWQEIRGFDMGDIDHDGIFDVALGEADGRLFVALGQGDGTFVPMTVPAELKAVGGGALALEEISGDDILDLVSCSNLGADGLGQAYVRTARGDGSAFGLPQTVAGLASTDADGRALPPLLADLDGDGTTEIILVHGASGAVSVFPNAFDTFESYGFDKAGSGGIVPTLTSEGYSLAGTKVGLVIGSGLGGAFALVQLGMGRTTELFPAVAVPFKQLIVKLSGTDGSPGTGSFKFPVVLPADPAFQGLEFTVQAIIQDFAVFGPAPFGFSVTKGLAFTIVP